MPTIEEIQALLTRDQWLVLVTLASTLAVRYAGALCRRRPRPKDKGDVLVDNVLARLREQPELDLSDYPSSTIATVDHQLHFDTTTGRLRVGEDTVDGLLSRAQRKRLCREARQIAADYLRRKEEEKLALAVRLTTPYRETVLLDRPWLTEGSEVMEEPS